MDITRSRLCGCALLGHSTDIPFRSFAHVCLRFPYGPQASTDSTHQHLCPIFMQTERNKQSSHWEDLQQPSQKLPHQVESLTVFFCVCVYDLFLFCFLSPRASLSRRVLQCPGVLLEREHQPTCAGTQQIKKGIFGHTKRFFI